MRPLLCREAIRRPALLAALLVVSPGCASYGGGVNAWVSHRGTPRYEVALPVMGPEVRSQSPHDADRARTYSFLFHVTTGYTADAPGHPGGFTTSVGPSFGVDQFRGRTGVGGLLTLGALLGPERNQGRFFVRTQLRLQRELNQGDWGIDPDGYKLDGSRRYPLRTPGHHLLGLTPGVELATGNHERPYDVSFGMGLLYRYLFEVTSLGP